MKIILVAIKSFVVIALFWFLYTNQSINLNALKDLWSQPSILFITMALMVLSTVIAGIRLYVVLRTMDISVTAGRSVGVTFMGHLAANVALGPLFSEMVRFTFLFGGAKRGWSHAATALLIDRLLGLGGLLVVVSGIIFCFAGKTALEPLGDSNFFLVLILGIFLVTLLIVFSPRVATYLSILLTKVGRLELSRQFKDLSAALNNFRVLPTRAFSALFLMILTHIVSMGANVYFCLEASTHIIKVEGFAIATALAQLSNAIPISPAGFGVGEAVFDKVCRLFSDNEMAYGFASIFLTLRVLSVFSSLPALLFVVFLRVRLKER